MSDFNNINKKSLGIDVVHLSEKFGDDKNLIIQALDSFVKSSSDYGKALSPEVSNPDFLIAAHSIKNSADSICAHVLEEICSQAEEQARTHMLSHDEKFVWREQIIQVLSETLEAVKEYKANIQN